MMDLHGLEVLRSTILGFGRNLADGVSDGSFRWKLDVLRTAEPTTMTKLREVYGVAQFSGAYLVVSPLVRAGMILNTRMHARYSVTP